jgi:hypothetical protein
MKQTLVAVICLTLAAVSFAAEPTEPPKAKKKAQHATPTTSQTQPAIKGARTYGQPARKFSAGPQQTPVTGMHQQFHPQTNVAHSQTNVNVAPNTSGHLGGVQRFHPRQFTVATEPKASIPGATFRADRHIHGSEAWQGTQYEAFRTYRPQWHHRDWWRHHCHRIVFIYGGWYFWNAGWWYPAWGYDANAYYPYDGPIYAYNDLSPDQVIANVQAALQEQGYYTGEVDGILGPLTRAALARFQEDHGLYITSAIDPPTLQSLGMS